MARGRRKALPSKQPRELTLFLAGGIFLALVFGVYLGQVHRPVELPDQSQPGDLLPWTDLDVLAYTTPWNRIGQDRTLQLLPQLDQGRKHLVSPVWLQLRPDSEGTRITGEHDVDEIWLKRLRSSAALVLPRVLLESWSSPEQILHLLKDQQQRRDAARQLVQVCRKHSFDGFTLEIMNSMVGVLSGHAGLSVKAEFLESLGMFFGDVRGIWKQESGQESDSALPPHPVLVLVLPSYPLFSEKDWPEALVDSVDYYQIMTYDYHPQQQQRQNFGWDRGGLGWPVAPLAWVRSSLNALFPAAAAGAPNSRIPDRRKILMGLNLYGYDYFAIGPEQPKLDMRAVTFNDILELESRALRAGGLFRRTFDSKVSEEFIEYSIPAEEGGEGLRRGRVFFPTRRSIAARLDLAREMGLGGVAMWEMGQPFQHDVLG